MLYDDICSNSPVIFASAAERALSPIAPRSCVPRLHTGCAQIGPQARPWLAPPTTYRQPRPSGGRVPRNRILPYSGASYSAESALPARRAPHAIGERCLPSQAPFIRHPSPAHPPAPTPSLTPPHHNSRSNIPLFKKFLLKPIPPATDRVSTVHALTSRGDSHGYCPL